MGLIDTILSQRGSNVDVANLAAKVGLSQDQVEQAIAAKYRNGGQACGGASRVCVQGGIWHAFAQRPAGASQGPAAVIRPAWSTRSPPSGTSFKRAGASGLSR